MAFIVAQKYLANTCYSLTLSLSALEAGNAVDNRRNNSRLTHIRRRDCRAADHSRRSGLADAQYKPAEAGADRTMLSARRHISGRRRALSRIGPTPESVSLLPPGAPPPFLLP